MAEAKALQQWKVDEPYIDLHCALGEGPYYEKATNTLRFTDIIKKHIHTFSLDKGPESLTTITLDSPVGVTANIEGADPQDKILAGLKHGIALLDRKSGKYEYLSKYANPGDRLRSNDGAADPHGRFWLGSMTDFGFGDFQEEGSLFCFRENEAPDEVIRPLRIPNSVGWSPDRKTMYFTHTTARHVFAFDYSPSGSLSNQRLFYEHEGEGFPDGFRVDVDGNIWHAFYGGSQVLKISPQGEVLGRISLPTCNITCVEFVGTELFITSAADEIAQGGERSREFGGGLFRVDVGTTGLQHFEFKLGTA